MDQNAQKYNNLKSEMRCSVAGQAVVGGILTEKEFFERIKTPFEEYEFYIPKHYDKYLKSLYGNYMVMPPENKRVTHELLAYYK